MGIEPGRPFRRVAKMWTRHFANSSFALAWMAIVAPLAYATIPPAPLTPALPGQSAPEEKKQVPGLSAQAGSARDAHAAAERGATTSDEIPIERCDRLPVVKVRVGPREMRFLVDTAATSMLNLKSFGGGGRKEIEITSWSGTAATSAREVSIAEFSLGRHHLRNLKLPAIDLSPIGNACGGPIDGILGVDLLDEMAATIDLKRQIASLGAEPADAKMMYADMEGSMHSCAAAFEQGKAAEFGECLDPQIVFYTPHGEYVGREQVLGYLRGRYFQYAPDLRYRMKLHEVQAFGNALWYSYDYSIDTPNEHLNGHGFAMCRRSGTRWRMLNMHNAFVEDPATEVAKP